MSAPPLNLAVLIDADNAQAAAATALLAEIARHGTATIRRAYGDWTTPTLRAWKQVLHALAIQPVQQFSYTTGKNATDSALIIDAMDILHGGAVSGFCIVSSDSDYTRLATRIREAGRVVYGYGEQKTPAPFVNACDKFTYTEVLRPAEPARIAAATLTTDEPTDSPPALEPLLRAAIEASAREDGWAHLGTVGHMAARMHPSFDARNHGFSRLSDLVNAQPYLETRTSPAGPDSPQLVMYTRVRARPQT